MRNKEWYQEASAWIRLIWGILLLILGILDVFVNEGNLVVLYVAVAYMMVFDD